MKIGAKNLIERLKKFLQDQSAHGKKLLLGYSGGPDSKALLYALLILQKEFHYEIHLAHVDHGWREESQKEAEQILKEAQSLDLFVYSKKLDLTHSGNAENNARIARYDFFTSLYHQHNFHALLLAHHADDVAETFIQRVMEGSDLPYLGGIQTVSIRGAMMIWRPLIGMHKHQILSWLEKKKISYFHDKTNGDIRYLRANMRVAIFPFLQKNLAKNIAQNLAIGSKRSWELKCYLDRKIAPFIASCISGPLGLYLDFTPFAPLETIELRHFIKYLASRYQLVVSREMIDRIVTFMLMKEANKKIGLKKGFFYIDHQKLFLVLSSLRPFEGRFLICEGTTYCQGWRIEVSRQEGGKEIPSGGWEALWKGEASQITIPDTSCFFSGYKKGMRFVVKRLNKIWYDAEVPAFLREIPPVVVEDDRVIGDFLSKKFSVEKSFPSLKILLQIDPSYYN